MSESTTGSATTPAEMRAESRAAAEERADYEARKKEQLTGELKARGYTAAEIQSIHKDADSAFKDSGREDVRDEVYRQAFAAKVGT